ncbi:response regulator receiver domain-containing protein [Palleronia aestuarii]|uniref:Response regulator receiver domain-containing protein n=1 Tax=Palleronia aestuarii TaxID=568105 RepID=A0A2W7NDI9_9RHOB|nr:response regulator [Palleronia aestuarii]PZX18218.1 response regulator receiver domain-containing protein [Palleronia aestuarii]
MSRLPDPPRYAVLVVENDPVIRAEAMDLAIEAGFKAYGARDAERAIRALERHDEIRICFTDVDMPGSCDGVRLAAAVRERWPPVEFIIVSSQAKATPDEMPARSVAFSKPYDPTEILHALGNFGRRIQA